MTATPEMLIDAYTNMLRHGDLDASIMTHVTGTKFVSGNTPISDPCPLNWMLLECFDSDAHFVQYRGRHSVRCVKADAANYDLSFRFCAVDLDFGQHGRRPTRLDFSDLCRTCHVIGVEDHLTPSILYETRGGARAIWLIEEITDPEEFEAHYASLLNRLDTIFCRCEHAYRVDVNVRDWTRLYRCPLVCRDGVKEFMRLVRLFHTDVLDLRTFKPKKKPERKPTVGNLKYTAHDARLLQLIQVEMQPGNRNNALFSGLCHVYRKYDGDGAAKWIENLREAALNAGIDESEFASANKSAQKQKGSN